MQIIQPTLGNNIHPLGIRASLSNPHKMLLRKESHSLNSRSNFISSIQNKLPLVTSSKFFLSREYEPSIQPLIGWDSWDTQDINNEFSLLEFDSADFINPLENSNINSSETVKASIPEIIPTRIENNTSNDTSSEINISAKNKSKSKSKKTNKSQQPPEKKSATKSKTKKPIKSSATKFIDKSNIPINSNENSLLASDKPLLVEANLELPTLQLDIALDNITNDDNSIGIITPSVSTPNLSDVKDKLTLFNKNITNKELQEKAKLAFNLPSGESSEIEGILQLQQENKLDDNTSDLAESSLVELPFYQQNVDQTFVPHSLLGNDEQQIIPEASELVSISDIPVRSTLPQQDIETDQLPSIIDNQSIASSINLIDKNEVLSTFISPSPEEKSSYISGNSDFEAITDIGADLILENNLNNFATDNFVADNSLENTALLSTLTSPDLNDTLHVFANDENIVRAHSYTPPQDVAVPNSQSSVAKSPITIQQEIVSSFTSQSPASIPIQLTPTSADIEDTPSLFQNSDNHQQLVTLESQSAIADNLLDVSTNVTSLQDDSSIENTINEYTESYPILALPEIVEIPAVTATSPEIVETPTVIATSPKIVETPTIIATSPEIGEALAVTATSPEIDETVMSHEDVNTSTIPATLPKIVTTESIFRKTIDNEQLIESELPFAVTNSEISTKVDISDNPDNPDIPEEATSAQNEVTIPSEVEQNATIKNLPAPKGYATGGHVTDSHVENRQQIAPSDTVPAMLTPGEFVINIRDAQKNLPLLHHINTGGTPQDIILPSLQTPNPTEPEETTSPETPTKVDSFPDTSLQLKSTETYSPQISNSVIPSSLGLNISKQKLSILNSPQLNPLQNETIDVDEPSPQYSSPPLIFRKANPRTNTPSQWSNTPSQWSSVEDLLNGNNDEFTSFNFSDVESNSQNYDFSYVSESPQVFAKHLPTPRGFADGGEVTPPDISREIQPITETIENTSLASQEDDTDDTANIEALAREIYHRLRQRIEIERERHGGYSGRLPW
ncbi:hypothetical protein [Nostoc sp. NMS8]|uniref:hypothetical protein n=1 Tax=Nostoc sp. NMS8 TaxID=2815392 RepID=UPI0025F33EB0|nr:hypothetical protein [Nostoc sp. NMS8]MBN3960846.1 hypothetical protein [Nostoc sp. NMS8]